MTVSTAAPKTDGTLRCPFDLERIRGDFPILQRTVSGKPLIYLDNASTTQKPQSVIDAISRYYLADNANVHRGVHTLSIRATRAYEQARIKIQQFIGASRPEEIVFVHGATEGVNLVAQTFGRSTLHAGDEIVITAMEHHSNIVPWQILCRQTDAILRVAPINDRGELLLDAFEKLVGDRTRLVAVTHVSNALGTVNPIRKIVDVAHRYGAWVIVDGAQAGPHLKVDVADLGCDFYVISGHKLFGPTGIGILYGRFDLLNAMPPYQSGGEMIKTVTFEEATYNDVPHKFEAGTPNIAGAIGLGAAVDYVNNVGIENIEAYESELLEYATQTISAIPGVRLIGTAREKVGILSFIVDGLDPHDIGTILDQRGIAIRTGHHCAQPLLQRLNVPETVRVSPAFYTTGNEIDVLVCELSEIVKAFT